MGSTQKIKRFLGAVMIGSVILGAGCFSAVGAAAPPNATKVYSEQACQDGRYHGQKFQDKLDQLVAKGIISREQADEWAKFHEKKVAERKAEREKIKKMTKEERQSYFAKMKKERGKGLDEVVKAGIITQEQADQIKQLFHHA